MTSAPAFGGLHGLVWVNTEKHVYHRGGSRFYGTTKKGEYMTEREAIQTGNKAVQLRGGQRNMVETQKHASDFKEP